LATAQAHVTASDSSASVGLPVAAVMTAVMRCPATNVFAAVAVAVAGIALLTDMADNPVTFVPLIWIATLNDPLPVK
jgi:poly(3-hydroxybutyrate) depolymerase